MATFSEIIAHIEDDLERSDIAPQVKRAVLSAIRFHEGERFWFNETRDYTFQTVSGAEEYAITETSGIADFEKVDYLKIRIGSLWEPVGRISPTEMEALNDQVQTGQPYNWSYYNKKFRLYPVPNDAYTVRVAGHYKLTALADDSDENAWTVEAEDMIEERAKSIIYAKTLHDPALASVHAALADDFLTVLRTKTGRRTGTGRIKPWC